MESGSQIADSFCGVHTTSTELGVLKPTYGARFIAFELKLDPSDHSYDYSKLYYSYHPDAPYTEEQVICFRVRWRGRFEPVQLQLPADAAASDYLRFRLDGLPYSPGTFEVQQVRCGALTAAEQLGGRAQRPEAVGAPPGCAERR